MSPGDALTSARWSGTRVLVTGHTGFKGGWLSLWLKSLGARVRGLALAPDTAPTMFGALKLEEVVDSHFGDIRDEAVVESAMGSWQPEIVFHVAAQSLVRRSYARPLDTYATNVMGTVHVLEAARRCKSVRAIVVVTTDKCYENREWVWGYRESDQLGGYDPYSSSKACAELISAAYRRSFFENSPSIGLATARAGNVIGGGDWAEDRLVPDAVRAFAANKSARIRNAHAIRPWQHVLEPLAGYLVLADALRRGDCSASGAWNFGPADSDVVSVSAVLALLVDAWGASASWETTGASPLFHEAAVLKLDASKARGILRWAPRWHLRAAIRRTVAWYQAFYSGMAAHELRGFTMQQIEDYQADGVGYPVHHEYDRVAAPGKT